VLASSVKTVHAQLRLLSYFTFEHGLCWPCLFSEDRTRAAFGRLRDSCVDVIQDPTIRTVLEYSQDEDFMDLPELFLNREELQQDVAMDPRGIDLEDNFVVDTTTGKVKAGRFIFSKQRPCEDFIFPRTRVLENGAVYYFKNYKVRGDCRSLDDHTQYPSEVLTRPYFLEVSCIT
jgi:hypothetical protein